MVKQGRFSPVMPVDDFSLAAVLHLVLEAFKFGPDTPWLPGLISGTLKL